MKIWTVALVMLTALHSSAKAHELQASRATLVLRDNQHLAVAFFVDYPAVLHQALAPQMLFREFALQHSAMPAQVFAAALATAQRKLQSATRVVSHGGKTIELKMWAWPTAAATQQAVQQRAMQAVVAPGDHAHTPQTEIRAEAQSTNPRDFASVTLQLPVELKDTLLVSYQPKQVWVKTGTASPLIRF